MPMATLIELIFQLSSKALLNPFVSVLQSIFHHEQAEPDLNVFIKILKDCPGFK